MMYNTYYGGFRTRTFADIFPDINAFESSQENCPIAIDLSDSGALDTPTLYYMLYAKYGNSHISYSDENQFEYALWTIVKQYGVACSKRLDVQQKLVSMSDDELVKGGKAIYNHAFNPNTNPSTSTLEELLTINDQNTTNYKKSKLEGYSILLALLETDVIGEFLSKFRPLFLTVVAADYPLLYETTIDPEDI